MQHFFALENESGDSECLNLVQNLFKVKEQETMIKIELESLAESTSQEQIYSKLKDNKIYYNDGKSTN